MNMQAHILVAMKEQMQAWETLLDTLDGQAAARSLGPGEWSVKDELAHLMAWQQRTLARVHAAVDGGQPLFPAWSDGVDVEDYDNTEVVNGRIHALYKDVPWEQVRQGWKDGYHKLLEAAGQVTEPALLDGGRFAWMGGRPLALVLLATYDHHQEHLESLAQRLRH